MVLPTRRRRIAAALCTGVLALGLLAFAAMKTGVGQHASARVIRWLAGSPERPGQDVVFERQSAEARAAMEAEQAALLTGGEDEGSLAPQGEDGADDGPNGKDGELLAAETLESGPPLDLVAEMKRTARPKGLPGVSYLLLLGTDKSHPKLRGRTDAIIVLAFRDRDGAIAAFSVPRDLWVEIPDLKYARINSVARVGDVEYGRGKGIPLLKKMLELELGVRVDHYALVDFAGFRGIVDALGGVDVDVPCPIVDCFWSNGRDQPCVPLDVASGRQRMDGVTALMYARSRHGRGDFDRSRRQQAVIAAIVRKVRAGGLSGLHRAWETASPYLETDLDLSAALYYASFALENDVGDIRGFSFASSAMTRKFVTEDKKHVLLLDHDRFDAALATLFERPLPAMSPPKRCPDAAVALKG